MKVTRGREGRPSEYRTDTFTGHVWGDVVLADEGLMVNNVFFAPRARTYWHRHSVAQVLHVVSGRGLLWSDEGSGSVLEPGDVAHIPAGERHWHGGGPDSTLLHLAVSVGPTEWLDEVSDDEYEEVVRALI
ncbi:MAG TPA: cupin domain-containing protein [Solirubrobacteraceae bacterium]|nr:cupin domain-containing protein [Solirubrobacteraceae bacterium]